MTMSSMRTPKRTPSNAVAAATAAAAPTKPCSQIDVQSRTFSYDRG